MATQEQQEQNVNFNPAASRVGMNLDSSLSQIPQGFTTYALNCQVENFDGNNISYQNEQANELCVNFPSGFRVIGKHNIPERSICVFFLKSPSSGENEIGVLDHNTCTYTKKINASCLNFSIDYPILKAVHKITNCSTEVYWTDGFNERRFIDLDNLPYLEVDECPPTVDSSQVDCNKLSVQPKFSIPSLTVEAVDSDGSLKAGTYQFAVQYCNVNGEEYTSYYSVTNPAPIFDPNKITLDFNYEVSKSINIKVEDIDTSGFFDYINIAVIKSINNIVSIDLVGTFQITGKTRNVSYTGQSAGQLDVHDIFQKFPIYNVAQDLTAVSDILIWDQLTTDEQLNYQRIANQIQLQWQTWRADGTNKPYANPINSIYLRGYMRDEVYPYEIVFLLENGKQTDGFHIPGRPPTEEDLAPISNSDTLHDGLSDCDIDMSPLPRWKVYNTGCLNGYAREFENFISGHPSDCFKCPPGEDINPNDPRCYVGPFQYGCMSYWESTETYPCNPAVWGDLSGKPIRHHKFPDSLITHIHDNEGFIYPIGVRVDVQQILSIIANSDLTGLQKEAIQGFKIVRGNRATNKSIIAKGLLHNVGKYGKDGKDYYFPNYPYNDLRADPFLSVSRTTDDSGNNANNRLSAYSTDDSKKRYVFHSPDTSFYQPTLPNILKLETAEYGVSGSHFTQIEKHARYKFLTSGAYGLAIGFAVTVGLASATVGTSVQVFDGVAAVASFEVFLDIVQNLLPLKNMTYSFNSKGEYTSFKPVQNTGNKQRRTDLQVYLTPGMHGVGDDLTVNNYRRESSVYLRTQGNVLPYVSSIPGVPQDESRRILSEDDCGIPQQVIDRDISSYYGAIKRIVDNQYGQVYSYETIDTGFQWLGDPSQTLNDLERYQTVFGGDIFINKFAYKSKLPFFLDNRVNFPDEADVEFDEIPNIGYPIFWFSTGYNEDSDGGGYLGFFKQVLGVKFNNFDCEGSNTFYQSGKIYLFAYGVPYFYSESEVNVDLRQAFNEQAGDFFPRVSSEIPDDWFQEINTTIKQDNTYYYNKSFSKQNKENNFSHLPADYTADNCRQNLLFRAIFSEEQGDIVNYDRNNWLLYRPESKFDFPRNYGGLVSLEAIEDKQVLARFENRTLLYNAMSVAPTSTTEIYLGGSLFLKQVPPQDLAADSDLGYMGTQHKLFVRSEYGHISVDSKRGQVFLIPKRTISYNKPAVIEISNKGMSKFFTENLDFSIKKAFPSINIDNSFKDIGLTGVYDTKYNRFILTKLDYEPATGVTYSNGTFYSGTTEVSLTDSAYFCNKSFTISFDFDTEAWVSFHSYLPNYYVGESNYFYSGVNSDELSSLWRHNTVIDTFNNYYGEQAAYTLEYPLSFKTQDEILHSIKDYSKVFEYIDSKTLIEVDDYFNKMVITSPQNCSGLLNLAKKPLNNLNSYMKFPVYNTDSKGVIYTKSDSFYNVNTFWGLIKDKKKPIWQSSCVNLSVYKDLNQDNMNYSKRSFQKEPLRGKDLRVRLTLDDKDNIKIVSQFTLTETQKSYK